MTTAPRLLSFTTFPGVAQTTPTLFELTAAELVARLGRRISAAAGDVGKMRLPLFNLTRFAPGATRGSDGVVNSSGIILDIDEAPPGTLAAAVAKLHALGVVFVVYTSHSHQAAAEKFRVVVPTDRDLSPAEVTLAWAGLSRLLGVDGLGMRADKPTEPVNDPAGGSPAHQYFLPSTPTPAGALPQTHVSQPGAELHSAAELVLEGIQTLPPMAAQPAKARGTDGGGSDSQRKLINEDGTATFAGASERYAKDHPEVAAGWSDTNTTCPICEDEAPSFKRHPDNGLRWVCHSSHHAATGVGKAAKSQAGYTKCWTGDTVDFVAHSRGLSPLELLEELYGSVSDDAEDEEAEAAPIQPSQAGAEEPEPTAKRDWSKGKVVWVAEMERFAIVDADGRFTDSNLFKPVAAVEMLRAQSLGFAKKKAKEIVFKKQCAVVQKIVQLPSNDTFVSVAGLVGLGLNINPHGIPEPVEGDWSFIRRQVEFLCKGDAGLVEHLLNWAAFCTQFPAERPMTAIILQGGFGVGKTQLGKLIGYCRGSWVEIGNEDISSTFNSHWAMAGFIVANEIFLADSKRRESEKLKALITDSTCRVEFKGVPADLRENHRAWWITSNHTAPVEIGEGDRRYTVIQTPEETPEGFKVEMGREYGAAERAGYENWSQLKAFRYYLLHRECDRAAARRPYDTEARQEAIQASKSSVQDFTDEVLDRGLAEVLGHAADGESTKFDDDRVGYSSDAVYQVYREMTLTAGKYPVAKTRLTAELKRWGWSSRKGGKGKRFVLPPVPVRPTSQAVAA